MHTLHIQEAQLSQRGRAMLRAVEYIAKSLKINQRHCRLKWYHWIDRIQVPVVTMVLFCIVSEIKRDVGRKSRFFSYPPAFDAPVRGSLSENCYNIWCGKARTVDLPHDEHSLKLCLLVSAQYTNVTDRQTDNARRHRSRLCRHGAAMKENN